MTKLEQEREAIKRKPKAFENLLELMRKHASMLDVYEYVDDFSSEVRRDFEKICDQCENVDACILASKNCTAYLKLKGILEGDVKSK